MADVKRAFRRQAAKWHPDKWACKSQGKQEAAAEEYQRLQEAYDELAP